MLDPELGTEADLDALHAALAAHGMGLVLDIVPNHMAASQREPRLGGRPRPRAGLAATPAGSTSTWRASERELRSRVLLPVLGDPARRCSSGARSRSSWSREGVPRRPLLRPRIPPGSVDAAGGAATARWRGCRERLRAEHPAAARWPRSSTGCGGCPAAPPGARRRSPAGGAARGAADALGCARLAAADARGRAGDARGRRRGFGAGPDGRRGRLRRLLDAQVYRLVHWRRAAREINYRRFFDVERSRRAAHGGSRGLRPDPRAGARVAPARLGGWIPDRSPRRPARPAAATSSGWPGRISRHEPAPPDLRGEDPEPRRAPPHRVARRRHDRLRLPQSGRSAVHRSRRKASQALEADYRRVIRQPLNFPDLVAARASGWCWRPALSAGVRRLAERLLRLGAAPPGWLAALGPGSSPGRSSRPSSRCRCTAPTWTTAPRSPRARTGACSHDAPAGGTRPRPGAGAGAGPAGGGAAGPRGADARAGARRGQAAAASSASSSSAVPPTAKGVEDTAFYAYAPLLSRNEVGGGPGRPARSRVGGRFTRATLERAASAGRDRCSPSPPTTPSAPPTCAPGSISWPSGPTSGSSGSTAGGASTSPSRQPCAAAACPIRRPSITCSRRWWGSGPTSRSAVGDAGGAARADRRIHAQGGHGRPSGEPAGPTPTPGSRPRCRRTSRRSSRRRGLPACSTSSSAGSPASVAPGWWTSAARTVLHLTSPGIPDLYQGDELGMLGAGGSR